MVKFYQSLKHHHLHQHHKYLVKCNHIIIAQQYLCVCGHLTKVLISGQYYKTIDNLPSFLLLPTRTSIPVKLAWLSMVIGSAGMKSPAKGSNNNNRQLHSSPGKHQRPIGPSVQFQFPWYLLLLTIDCWGRGKSQNSRV